MPRPKRCRRICKEPIFHSFAPDRAGYLPNLQLSVDEYEAIRLIDYQRTSHEQCARQMDISRTTVTEIYENARRKIAECLVQGKRLVISGGNYRLCTGKLEAACVCPCDGPFPIPKIQLPRRRK